MRGRIAEYQVKEVGFQQEYKEMKQGVIYLSREWQCVKFLCPCGCGVEVFLPISPAGSHPHVWSFSEQAGVITIALSIQQLGGCRSHFFIQNNKVVWA